MKTYFWPLAFILLAALAAVLWLSKRSGPAGLAEDADVALLTADYDYYIQGLQTTRFGSDGQAVSQLRAERIAHYPEGDRAELQTPRFSAFGPVGDAWQVSAETGTLAPDTGRVAERLDLKGQVVLNKPLVTGDFLEVRTAALTLYTGTEEVVTDQPVTLQTRDTRLDGTGMHALLARENIKLLKDVRGIHDPTPRP